MVKHIQVIRQLLPMNCLIVFNHFAELAFKGLRLGKQVNFGLFFFFDVGTLRSSCSGPKDTGELYQQMPRKRCTMA